VISFSPQLDKSTNVSNFPQLLVFIKMVLDDLNIKEELMNTVPVHGKTRGEDIFQSFDASLLEVNTPIYKLMLITTGGGPATASENADLIELCKKDSVFKDFLVTTLSFIRKL
jgi:hypothetical protein